MKIIGVKFEKIIAERLKDHDKNINLKTNFNVSDLKKEDFPTLDKEAAHSISFNYTLDYEEVAKIEFKGILFFTVDKKGAKELGKDENSMSSEMKKNILNYILVKTHVEALHLEEKLNLPFHIAAPKVDIKEEK